jgi:hypothetical protein
MWANRRSLHLSRWFVAGFISSAIVLFAPTVFAQEQHQQASSLTNAAPQRPASSYAGSDPAGALCEDPPDQQQDPRQAAQSSGAANSSPDPARQPGQPGQQNAAAANPPAQDAKQPSDQNNTKPGQQPKRILGIMPNFRAVSAGALPPPPTAKQSFKIATQNSFDYSSFIFVGITSLLAEGTNAHPDLGKGIGGFGGYYWRGFLDKTDGNYLVIFALPTILHEDERYYAKGTGPVWKRAAYAASRILITPDYHGHNTVNASELLGRAMAQGISIGYYPAGDRTASALASKYAFALGRDALTNVFREFWPDIAKHVLHRHP